MTLNRPLLIGACFVLLAAGSAAANSVKLLPFADNPYTSYQDIVNSAGTRIRGYAGEFTFKFISTDFIPLSTTFQTFCLETNENVNWDTTYDFELSDTAWN